MKQSQLIMKAPIAYLAGVENKPETLVFPKLSGKDTVRPRQVEHIMELMDVRRTIDKPTLHEHGFELLTHESETNDLYDNQLVRTSYYAEMVMFLKKHLRAYDVIVFDHNQRSKIRADKGELGMRYPVASAHVDYTHSSGMKRAQDILRDERKDDLINRNLSLINVWRPIKGPVEDMPLGVCAGGTVNNEDLVETKIRHFSEDNSSEANHTGSIYSLRYNNKHKWFYVSSMMPHEVLILKNWHSPGCEGVFNSPHTGFNNPVTPSRYVARESIEVRTLVIF